MAERKLGAILSLTDNVSGSLKGIKQEQIAFRKEVKKTKEQMDKKAEIRVDNSSALKKVKQVGSAIRNSKLGKAVTTTLAAKDRATAGIKKVKSNLKSLISKPFNAVIAAKDKTKGVIDGIKDKLFSLKSLAGGIAIGAVAKAGFDNIIKPGSELEGYKTSMTHWMGGDEKGADAYLGQLRKEADLTPFETGEVIQAGSRAIGLSGGDTKSAMEMVKLSEDMASLTPGKSVSDAMEAIADAQMGEMERLKEFSFKGSKEQFDAAGGNLMAMKGTNGKTLQEMFGGGAEKLSQTASGKASTITGNLQSGLQTGGAQILERLKPVLDKLVPASEKLAEKLPVAIDFVADKFTSIWTYLQPGVQALVTGFMDLWQKSEPFRNVLGNLGQAVLPFVKTAFEAVGTFMSEVMPPILDALGVIIENVVIPAFDAATKIIDNIVKPAFEGVGKIIKDPIIPIFETLGGAIKKVIDFVGGITGGIRDGLSAVGDFFFGSDEEEAEPHATGLQRVPYNGYLAELHKDEAVIPAISNPYNPNFKGIGLSGNKTTNSTSSKNSKVVNVKNIEIKVDAKDRDDKEAAEGIAKELLLIIDNI